MKLLARFLLTFEETHLVNRDIEGDVRDALVKIALSHSLINMKLRESRSGILRKNSKTQHNPSSCITILAKWSKMLLLMLVLASKNSSPTATIDQENKTHKKNFKKNKQTKVRAV